MCPHQNPHLRTSGGEIVDGMVAESGTTSVGHTEPIVFKKPYELPKSPEPYGQRHDARSVYPSGRTSPLRTQPRIASKKWLPLQGTCPTPQIDSLRPKVSRLFDFGRTNQHAGRADEAERQRCGRAFLFTVIWLKFQLNQGPSPFMRMTRAEKVSMLGFMLRGLDNSTCSCKIIT